MSSIVPIAYVGTDLAKVREMCEASRRLQGLVKICEWTVHDGDKYGIIYAATEAADLRELGARWCSLTLEEITNAEVDEPRPAGLAARDGDEGS